MKSPTRRIAVAAAAAVLSVGVAAPSIAAGHEASGDLGTHSRLAGKKQVLSLIKVADQTLRRISESGPIRGLDAENQSAVLDNISADRTGLAKMKRMVKRAHKPSTLERAQRNINRLSPQNYTEAAYLLGDSEDLLWAVGQCRRNLADDPTFSPEQRASLNAELNAVEARMKAIAADSRGVTARSSEAQLSDLGNALTKAEEDLDEIDNTIFDGGDA